MTHFHAVGIYCYNVSAHSKRKLADPVAQAKKMSRVCRGEAQRFRQRHIE
jgi:hypothetical protein